MTYKRVLLKISGEALSSIHPNPSSHFGINQEMLQKLATDIKNVIKNGVEVAIVVGGGNFFLEVQNKHCQCSIVQVLIMLGCLQRL
jgi:uridylate kinase